MVIVTVYDVLSLSLVLSEANPLATALNACAGVIKDCKTPNFCAHLIFSQICEWGCRSGGSGEAWATTNGHNFLNYGPIFFQNLKTGLQL